MKTPWTGLGLAAVLALTAHAVGAEVLHQLGLASQAASRDDSDASASLNALSEPQLVESLKEALRKGVDQAIRELGHEDGFRTNMAVRIPAPERLQSVERTLRAFRQDKLADDFIQSMNRAAEQAVPQAASVVGQAIQQMSVTDAKSILCGPKDAATQHFRRATQTNLFNRLLPIVKVATAKAGVTANYKQFVDRVHRGLGGALFSAESVDLDAYVTEKALDGLYQMMAQEEARIRDNPAARTTTLLQQVFSAVPLPPP